MGFIEMLWNVVIQAEIDLFYFRNAKVVGSTPIIGTIFSNKIIWLLLHCFAFLNTNVHFCALLVWQNCGRYSEIVCGAMQGYANSMCYLEAPVALVF